MLKCREEVHKVILMQTLFCARVLKVLKVLPCIERKVYSRMVRVFSHKLTFKELRHLKVGPIHVFSGTYVATAIITRTKR